MGERTNDDRPLMIESAVELAGSPPTVPFYRRAWPFFLALGALVIGILISLLIFGSLPIAIRYARGERLILEPAALQIDGLTTMTSIPVSTEIRNYYSKPVRILGSATNCSCVMVKSLPDAIPAGGSVRVSFEVRALPGKPKVDQRVTLFTDDSKRSQLYVHVTGEARD